MKRDEVFKSNYLNAASLKGRKVPVTIESVDIETLGQGKDAEDKPVVHFKGTPLGLVLNMTNWDTLQDLLGSDDSDDWVGKKVLLVPAKTKFGNKMVDCVRIEPHNQGANRRLNPEPPEPEPEDEEQPFSAGDDDVPF